MTTLAPPRSDSDWMARLFGVENVTAANLPLPSPATPTSGNLPVDWQDARQPERNGYITAFSEATSADPAWLQRGLTGLDALEWIAVLPMPENLGQFVQAYHQIDWDNQEANAFARAVTLALQTGAHLIARECALAGNRRFPDYLELQKMARILAPPNAKSIPGQGNPSWRANRAWLQQHWDDYRGHWVALRQGQLLAVADDVNGLVAQVGELKGTDILITSIW